MQGVIMRNTVTIKTTDIKAIELHCKCGAFISHPVERNLTDSIRCASCGANILQSEGKNTSIHRLAQALANLNDNSDKPCDVTFTIDVER